MKKVGRIGYIIAEIKDQYTLEDGNLPWVIGFSGGKDSTAMLQLVWSALTKIDPKQRKRDIYVICNDTLVENPIIANYVDKVLEKIILHDSEVIHYFQTQKKE